VREEAMMASMLIEQMRKSVPDSEFMPKSSGERIFESLLDYEYAQTMSRAGTFGITDLVLAEMRRNR
jgi:Rod binding domain-containing protein